MTEPHVQCVPREIFYEELNALKNKQAKKASRILNSAEQNYSQIKRRSLAIVFGVTKFCQYLLGRHFKLLTDHKSLITLLGKPDQDGSKNCF